MVSQKLNIGGAVVFWSLGWTELKELTDEFDRQGLTAFVPSPRTETSILKTALAKHFGTKDFIIRPLEDRDGFDVSSETRGADANKYSHHFSFRVSNSGQVSLTDVDGHSMNGEVELQRSIQAQYDRLKGLISPAVMGHMMVKLVDQCDGVSLRPTGGVYWIPDSHLAKWEDIADAIEASGSDSTCYAMHTAFDDAMVKAVRDGITMEITSEVDDIEANVKSGEIGKRACEARVRHSSSLEKKLERYEHALGESMTALHESLKRASTAAAQAAMQAVLNANNNKEHTDDG